MTVEQQKFCEKEVERLTGKGAEKNLICAQAGTGHKCNCPRAHNLMEYDLRRCNNGDRCVHQGCYFWHNADLKLHHETQILCNNPMDCKDSHCPFVHNPRLHPMCKFGDSCTRQICMYRHVRDNYKYSKFLHNLHRITLNKVQLNPQMRATILDSGMQRLAHLKKNGMLTKNIETQFMAEMLARYT